MERWINRQRGATMAMVVLSLPVLVGMLALSIDLGLMTLAKQELQNTADAAALAAAGALREGLGRTAAREQAVGLAAANTVLGNPVTLDPYADIDFGTYDVATGQFVSGLPSNGLLVVSVTARRTEDSPGGAIALCFSPIFGIETANVSAQAHAGLSATTQARAPVELIVVQDGSYSFINEIDYAKDGDKALVGLIADVATDGDQIGVVSFVARAWRERGLSPLPDETPPINSAIDNLHYCEQQSWLWLDPDNYYGTHTGAGIDEAVAMFAEHGSPDAEHVITLISDGMPFPEARRDLAVAAADRAAAAGITIHTVTLVQDADGTYGSSGADAEFNASLTRNGGHAFHTPEADELLDVLIAVATIEVGKARLVR